MKILQLLSILGLVVVFVFTNVQNVQGEYNQERIIEKLNLNASIVNEIIARKDDIRNFFLSHIMPRGLDPRIEIPEIPCFLCVILGGPILNMFYDGTDQGEIGDFIVGICKLLDIVDGYICEKVVDQFIDPGYFIIAAHQDPRMRAADVCAILLQANQDDCRYGHADWFTNWNIEFNQEKPAVEVRPKLAEPLNEMRALLLNDIHLDLHYHVGSVGDCGKITCCRIEDDDHENGTRPAGRWGDYNCDTPQEGLDDVFMNAASTYDYSMVLYIGDLVHHVIWETSIEDNIEHIRKTGESMYRAFPNVPIYPIIGNHEPHPVNMFPTRAVWGENNGQFSLEWMYDAMTNSLSRDLSLASRETFRQAGYYSQLYNPGKRIIAINTNYCYTFNFWLLHNPVDPERQLQWLSNELLLAERAGEKVWILGHHPMGKSDCWYYWNRQFNNLVNRYENIIMSQFYGHTHNDDFKIFFDETGRPTNALYIGASGTAYTDINPGYKVFFADEQTWEITNHETWVYNLTDANQKDQPSWYKLYDAKQVYGLDSFRPADLYDMVLRMVDNEQLFQDFYRFYNKDTSSDNIGPCVDDCKANYMCSMVTTNIEDQTQCNFIKDLVKKQKQKN